MREQFLTVLRNSNEDEPQRLFETKEDAVASAVRLATQIASMDSMVDGVQEKLDEFGAVSPLTDLTSSEPLEGQDQICVMVVRMLDGVSDKVVANAPIAYGGPAEVRQYDVSEATLVIA